MKKREREKKKRREEVAKESFGPRTLSSIRSIRFGDIAHSRGGPAWLCFRAIRFGFIKKKKKVYVYT